MKTRTACLSPGRVDPGTILARAVADRDGQTLLPAGTELDATLLDRLIRRGVEYDFVTLPDHRSAETIAEEIRAAEIRVETIFRVHENTASSATREALHAAVLAYRLESAQ
ncbi:hypothetical protein [Propionivibrio limicola]|uniref:hypothetical protein n=1 Tax=Propionivibrio limicola TaxID=167645 RepID=UPI0012921B2C|nr:hypothetical protein [Propionivibrio limicola]